MMLGQKATKGTSLAHPDGAIHGIDALRPTDWLDVVAMRVEGAASSWVNAVLQDISAGRRPIFCTCVQFKEVMV